MVIGGQRLQPNEKFWTNIQELSGTVHLYVLLTSLSSKVCKKIRTFEAADPCCNQ